MCQSHAFKRNSAIHKVTRCHTLNSPVHCLLNMLPRKPLPWMVVNGRLPASPNCNLEALGTSIDQLMALSHCGVEGSFSCVGGSLSYVWGHSAVSGVIQLCLGSARCVWGQPDVSGSARRVWGQPAVSGIIQLCLGSFICVWGQPAVSGVSQLCLGSAVGVWGQPAVSGVSQLCLGSASCVWGHSAVSGVIQLCLGSASCVWDQPAVSGVSQLCLGSASCVWGSARRVWAQPAVSGVSQLCPGSASCVCGHPAVSGVNQLCPGSASCVWGHPAVSGVSQLFPDLFNYVQRSFSCDSRLLYFNFFCLKGDKRQLLAVTYKSPSPYATSVVNTLRVSMATEVPISSGRAWLRPIATPGANLNIYEGRVLPSNTCGSPHRSVLGLGNLRGCNIYLGGEGYIISIPSLSSNYEHSYSSLIRNLHLVVVTISYSLLLDVTQFQL